VDGLVFGRLSRRGSGEESAVEPFSPQRTTALGQRTGAVDLADVDGQAELRQRQAAVGWL
jgi:hypothetical protein